MEADARSGAPLVASIAINPSGDYQMIIMPGIIFVLICDIRYSSSWSGLMNAGERGVDVGSLSFF